VPAGAGSRRGGAGPGTGQLLRYYLELGKGVVALGRPGDSVHPFEQGRVVLVGRPAERHALLRAVARHLVEGVVAHVAPGH
jgi:hypothetical protein